MDGVGLRCLARVYHQPLKQIYDSIKEYQENLDTRTGAVPTKSGSKRKRKTGAYKAKQTAKTLQSGLKTKNQNT